MILSWMNRVRYCVLSSFFLLPISARALLAGGEFALPSNTPSGRIDSNGLYDFVGALEIAAGGNSYYGSAVALSRNWVLTAGHNVDFNDDGLVDVNLGIHFHLPSYGSYAVDAFFVHPDFTGFNNPTVQYDLSLLYFDAPLPELVFPTLGSSLELSATATLVGFGRSGYGDYGYTTDATLTDRRFGFNVIDELEDGLFRYDFDDPDTGDGLGNDPETIIGPGD